MHSLRTLLRRHSTHSTRVRVRLQVAVAFASILALAGAGIAGAPKDPVVAALEHALRAYRGRDAGAAQAWTQVAASLLEREVAAQPQKQWILGNTAQLLPLLDLYNQVAVGRDTARDHEVFQLVAWLQQVDRINRNPARPNESDGVAVDYEPFSHLARKVGDVALEYSPFTLQIRKVGGFGIDYNPFTGQPRQIGPVAVDWDPFRPVVRSIAGVELH